MTAKTRIYLALYSFIGITALFFLPYYFPDTKLLSVSASSDYGFSNRAGIIILFLLCSGLVLYSWLKYPREAGILRYDELISGHDSILSGLFRKIFAAEVVFLLVIWFCIRDTFGVIESQYFISRLHDLLAGRKLYTEIDFAYGPLLLYIPALLFKIFSVFADVRIQDTYFLSLLIMQCLGFYWFYRVISRFRIEAGAKKLIFIVLSVLTLPVSSGMNYTLFRFITPYAALFWLLDAEHAENSNTPLYSVLLFLAVSLAANISPETGIVFSFTLFVSYTVKAFLNKSASKFVYGLISLASSALWFLLVPGMLEAFTSFLSGGLNWPFVVCYSLVFFFGTVFYFAFHAGLQLKGFRENISFMTVGLMACGMIPGALGRCDPGHILWDGLMLFIITASLMHGALKRSRIYAAALLFFGLNVLPCVIATAVPSYASALMENKLAGRFFYSDFGRKLTFSAAKFLNFDEEKVRFRFSKGMGTGEVPDALRSISDISMPFDGDAAIYIYLTDSRKYHRLPYRSDQGSGEAIAKNLDALMKEKPSFLLLPTDWDKYAEPLSYAKYISLLFATKFYAEPVRNSCELYRGTVEYISSAYEFAGEVNYSRRMKLYRLRDSAVEAD